MNSSFTLGLARRPGKNYQVSISFQYVHKIIITLVLWQKEVFPGFILSVLDSRRNHEWYKDDLHI